jgi:hypothetical protein
LEGDLVVSSCFAGIAPGVFHIIPGTGFAVIDASKRSVAHEFITMDVRNVHTGNTLNGTVLFVH